jgi:hypothetical protein
MGQRPLTHAESGEWLLPEYERFLPTLRTVKRRLREETIRCYGAPPETLRAYDPATYRDLFTDMESALGRSNGWWPAWLKRFGTRRIVAAFMTSPPWEIALAMLSLKHRRSTRWIYRRIVEARRVRRTNTISTR